MSIQKVFATYVLSFLSFIGFLVFWIGYGFERSSGLLNGAIITTCLFIFMIIISYKILFSKKRYYVLTANHIFYKFETNLFLESKLIKEKKNRNLFLKKYLKQTTYQVKHIPDTNFQFKVYDLQNGLELITYKEKNRDLFKHSSFFEDCKKNTQALIEFLGVEDLSIEEPIIDLKYSANKEWAVVITQEENEFLLRVYSYHNFWITTNIKKIFKELLPHWHPDRDYCDVKYKNLEDAINKMNQEIDFLDHSFSIPNNSWKENLGEKEND